jgi:hypothetical protein
MLRPWPWPWTGLRPVFRGLGLGSDTPGLGLGLGLAGSGLGLGPAGSGLGLGLSLVGPGLVNIDENLARICSTHLSLYLYTLTQCYHYDNE